MRYLNRSRTAIRHISSATLTCWVAFFSTTSLSAAEPLVEDAEHNPTLSQVAQLRAAAVSQELPGDSWRPELAETLLALGQALQRADDHEDALAQLERSVQISRINHGLFSTHQLPAIRLQIDSHLARDSWDEADSLRQYAFYISSRAHRDGDAALIPELIDYADWQLNAFSQRRGLMPAARLLDAYQLYAVALSIIDDHGLEQEYPREGYLHQLAFISWLMHRTRALNRSELVYSDERRVDDGWAEALTSDKYRTRNSAALRGQYALEEIVAIRAQHAADATAGSSARTELLRQQAEALLDLGDWHLLLDRRQAATAAYRQAWELLAQESAQLRDDVFERVVLIPTFEPRDNDRRAERAASQVPASATAFAPDSNTASADTLPTAERARRAWVTMEFDVNRFGRPLNVKVLETSVPDEDIMSRRLVSALRDSRMRPRIRDGEPAHVTGLVYRFPYEIESQVAQAQ